MSSFHNNALVGASGLGGYQIERSLRFNSADSAYLEGGAWSNYTTIGTPATFSHWVKLADVGTSNFMQTLSSRNYQQMQGFVINGGAPQWKLAAGGGATAQVTFGSILLRDPSAWYHLVISSDGSSSSSWKLWVNGVEYTGTVSGSFVGGNNTNTASLKTDNNFPWVIGRRWDDPSGYWNGLITECHLVVGQQLPASSFGETDTITGVWKPKKYSGSGYGTNGFYLKFADNSGTTSTTLGKDSSGNGNNWTPNNFSVTAGAGNDSMIDTPTPYADGGNGRGNYCTLNPLANGGTLANGNLQFSTGASHALAKSTFAIPSSGLWYAEATVSTLTSATVAAGFGLGTAALSNTAVASSASGAWEIYSSDLRYFNRNGTQTSITGTFAANDVLQVAVDMANSRAWVGVNNTWYNVTNGTTGDPGAGTNPTFTSLPSELFIIANTYSNTLNLNFGQRSFSYTPPAGFSALNTQNLPEPTIKKGSKYFDTVLYTGNGSTRTITGVGFQPDLVWIKRRDGAANHGLYDSVRGATKALVSSSTGAEVTDTGALTSFDADGFSLGAAVTTAPNVNTSGQTYVAWAWDANGAGSSNTAGTITSTVSANATAGFSIVTYTGTLSSTPGTAPTVGHGLGVAPSLIISKSRNPNGDDSGAWYVNHVYDHTRYLRLNSTASAVTIASQNGGTAVAPTSTVFSTYYIVGSNTASNNYVAYCFSEVAGYSKFGSYTGNGSTDGPFLFCGFQPKVLLIKSSSSGYDWFIFDDARNSYNAVDLALFPNASGAESGGSTYLIDFTSNGFKLRNTQLNLNGSGNTYIFAAFAELPAKYSNAR